MTPVRVVTVDRNGKPGYCDRNSSTTICHDKGEVSVNGYYYNGVCCSNAVLAIPEEERKSTLPEEEWTYILSEEEQKYTQYFLKRNENILLSTNTS